MPAVPTTTVRRRARRRQGLDALTDLEVWPYSDDEILNMSPLTRVAARAATLVYNKYIKKMIMESDMYYMAIAMCHLLKLKWFLDNGYSYDNIQKIRDLVITRFYQSYANDSGRQLLNSKLTIQTDTLHPAKRVNKYLHRQALLSTVPVTPQFDSIERYLADNVVPESVIAEHGGLVKYCTNQFVQFPQVFAMALDYITAPASSVNAERAFSNGCLIVNHLQHQMSSRTFQAKMAVGS